MSYQGNVLSLKCLYLWNVLWNALSMKCLSMKCISMRCLFMKFLSKKYLSMKFLSIKCLSVKCFSMKCPMRKYARGRLLILRLVYCFATESPRSWNLRSACPMYCIDCMSIIHGKGQRANIEQERWGKLDFRYYSWFD